MALYSRFGDIKAERREQERVGRPRSRNIAEPQGAAEGGNNLLQWVWGVSGT